jgi:hypothetical protein
MRLRPFFSPGDCRVASLPALVAAAFHPAGCVTAASDAEAVRWFVWKADLSTPVIFLRVV